ncbi:MAG: aminoglycoside phosphotransferase family protein [Oscillospiraceae bacterium]|nr:aminoglycoside phosphotransferase family protein [Oscillospiraceae bacterium]
MIDIKQYGCKEILPGALTEDNLKNALGKMLGKKITRADFECEQLHGGTVGDVRLVTGFAESTSGERVPYKIILKVQKKWARQDDPDSWRREYDLYKSDFAALFTDSLCWPECYHAEMSENETETRLWLEYIGAISGRDLTIEMREQAALELGRFQGRICARDFASLQNISCFSKLEIVTDYYMGVHRDKAEYRYIRSETCEIPDHIKQMFITIDDQRKAILENIPVILCHRDFWFENIFYSDAKIRLIDWDSSGFGYIGDDIVQLITDETDPKDFCEHCGKLIPAYIKGFSEYADVSWADSFHVWERIVIHFGYGIAKDHMNAKSPDEKKSAIDTLQKIYEMREIRWN